MTKLLLRAKPPTTPSTGNSAEIRQQLDACKDPKNRGKLVVALKDAIQREDAAQKATAAGAIQKRTAKIEALSSQLRNATTPAQKKALLDQIQAARAN
jgi:hypothetical protein